MGSERERVVSPEEAAGDFYPFVRVNEDGTARELHASEREFLETPFLPNDSSRPYVKPYYESRNSWGEVEGFCRRSGLPPGIEVAEAPLENPSPDLSPAEFIALVRKKYEAYQAREAHKSEAARGAGSPDRPAGDERSPEVCQAPPAYAESTEKSARPKRARLIGWGTLGAVAIVLIRIAVHHPQMNGRQQQPVSKPDRAKQWSGGGSMEAMGITEEYVVRLVNEQGFARIVACQRRLGISDESLDALLKRAWRAQRPDGQPPWEAADIDGADWRARVTWNVEAVEKVLERLAAGEGRASSPAAGPRSTD